jgi:hypothetical protein
MTDEQRLQLITEQLIIVRDNLFRGLSKSMQKLQAHSINEVLELPNYTQSPQQRTWVGLTTGETAIIVKMLEKGNLFLAIAATEAKLKEKNT